jgi:uncharacterized membrane protein
LWIVSAIFLALSALTKIYPIVLLPYLLYWLYKSEGLHKAMVYSVVFSIVCVVFFLPFLQESLLPITRYAMGFKYGDYNSSVYRIINEVGLFFWEPRSELVASILCLGMFVVASAIAVFRLRTFNWRNIVWAFMIYFLFTPLIYPWYVMFCVSYGYVF